MGAGGIVLTSRVLFSESAIFRFVLFLTVASTALAAFDLITASHTQTAGLPSFATQSASQVGNTTTNGPSNLSPPQFLDTLKMSLVTKRMFVLLVQRNFREVPALAEQLAKRNNPEGFLVLGELLQSGNRVPQDLVAARAQYAAATKLGEPDAALQLANMMERGLGGPQDRNGAINLYLFAARSQAAGADEQITRLGVASERGITVGEAYDDLILNRDADNASRLMHSMVQEKSSPALCFVGMLYLYGWTVQRNWERAAEYLSEGARRDYPWCQWGMAKISGAGTPTLPRNRVQAYLWYRLALFNDALAKRKASAEQELAVLEQQMSPEEAVSARQVYQNSIPVSSSPPPVPQVRPKSQ
jgi:TPR repeat protein